MKLTPHLQRIADRMNTGTWSTCRKCHEEYLENHITDGVCVNCEQHRATTDTFFENIPATYQNAKLSDFDLAIEQWATEFYSDHYISPSRYEPISDAELAQQPAIYQHYAEVNPLTIPYKKVGGKSKSAKGNFLVIHGSTGLGKTHMLYALHLKAFRDGMKSEYRFMTHLFDSLQDFKYKEIERSNLFHHLLGRGVQMLLLDDLGAEHNDQYARSKFNDLINMLWEKQVPTVITTNLTVKGLENVYRSRIFSRLFSGYAPIELTGQDKRISGRLSK